uniref:Uncharacterized protein n=1 Tax=Arundo donax TaxID=35708 RepID=A0A0A9A988_ARUDO
MPSKPGWQEGARSLSSAWKR